MVSLAKAWEKTGKHTYLELTYHRYLGNRNDEVEMKKFAGSLGFKFQPVWAMLLSVEKMINFVECGCSLDSFNNKDRQLVGRLALSVAEITSLWRKY